VLLSKAAVGCRVGSRSSQQSVNVVADSTILTTSGSDIGGDINARAMENLLSQPQHFSIGLFAPASTAA